MSRQPLSAKKVCRNLNQIINDIESWHIDETVKKAAIGILSLLLLKISSGHLDYDDLTENSETTGELDSGND